MEEVDPTLYNDNNIILLKDRPRLRYLMAKIRDEKASGEEFVIYSDLICRILLEEGIPEARHDLRIVV